MNAAAISFPINSCIYKLSFLLHARYLCINEKTKINTNIFIRGAYEVNSIQASGSYNADTTHATNGLALQPKECSHLQQTCALFLLSPGNDN